MSAMMGGQQDAQEDMFAKLESMRAVITEVNTQFKDPVSVDRSSTLILIPNCVSRRRQHLSVSVSQNSSRFTKQSD